MDQSTRSSRRNVLYGLALGGFGLATPGWAQALVKRGTSPLTNVLPRVQNAVREASLEGWAGAVGSDFIIRGEAGPRTVTLLAARALDAAGTRPADLRPMAFALVFEGAHGSQVPAGDRRYAFEKPDGTKVELFVGSKVAVGGKAQLVAVLN